MDLPVDFLTAKFRTDRGDALLLYRPIIMARFPTVDGQAILRRCMTDTGAPLSVVPYAVWHARNFKWSSVSTSLRGSAGLAALTWQGVPCELGEMQIDLAGPRVFVAKFALQPTPPCDVILGLNFLVDNDLDLSLTAVGGSLSGTLVV
ncbi:MAG: hypothetical protein NTY19_09655 [Planctomycetota bacterium]|nr:hypothetical protein [Planctomycetota bacterium]